MAYPEPEVGVVISYSYLWSDEAAIGHVDGRKARPCAIVMAQPAKLESIPYILQQLGSL